MVKFSEVVEAIKSSSFTNHELEQMEKIIIEHRKSIENKSCLKKIKKNERLCEIFGDNSKKILKSITVDTNYDRADYHVTESFSTSITINDNTFNFSLYYDGDNEGSGETIIYLNCGEDYLEEIYVDYDNNYINDMEKEEKKIMKIFRKKSNLSTDQIFETFSIIAKETLKHFKHYHHSFCHATSNSIAKNKKLKNDIY
jgi:hypothetical protein